MNNLYIKAQEEIVKGWYRPDSWCPRPDGWEDKKGVYWLVENNGSNYVYFQADKPVNMYVNDVLEISLSANQGQTMIIELFEEDYVSIEWGGKNWIWIYFEVEDGANISTYTNDGSLVGNKTGDAIVSNKRYVSTYEEIINLDNLVAYLQNDPGAVYKINKATQNVCFRPNCVVETSSRLFSSLTLLVNIENFPKITNWGGTLTFRGTTFNNHGVLDLMNTGTVMQSIAYQGWNFSSIKFINTDALTNLNSALSYSYASYIEIENCSNVTTAGSAFAYCTYLKGFKFNNLGVSFDITCTAMTEYNMLKGIESIRDLTGLTPRNIAIQNALHLNIPSVIAAANAKNWTISFI